MGKVVGMSTATLFYGFGAWGRLPSWIVLAGRWSVASWSIKYTDSLTLEGAAGGLLDGGEDRLPGAVLRVGSPSWAWHCRALAGRLKRPADLRLISPAIARFVGWEVAAGVRYAIMPGLTWTPRLASRRIRRCHGNQQPQRPGSAWSFFQSDDLRLLDGATRLRGLSGNLLALLCVCQQPPGGNEIQGDRLEQVCSTSGGCY